MCGLLGSSFNLPEYREAVNRVLDVRIRYLTKHQPVQNNFERVGNNHAVIILGENRPQFGNGARRKSIDFIEEDYGLRD